MKRALQYLLALFIGVLTSCKGGSEEVKPAAENELLVSIDNMQTRTALYERVKTKWAVGDKITLFSVHNDKVYSATYSCIENAQVSHFTLVSQDALFDVSEYEAAYYPGENAMGYDKDTKTIVVTIPAEQIYSTGSFGNGAAPLVSDVKKGEKEILFRNAFGAVCLQFFTQAPTAASNLTSITLESQTTKLNGTFRFTMSGEKKNNFTVVYPSADGTTSTTLSAGSSPVAISEDKDEPTPFYVMVPGTANNEQIDITVTTNKYTYYRSFISNNQTYVSSDPDNKYNKVATNNILKMAKLEVSATQLLSIEVDSWKPATTTEPELTEMKP